MPTKNRAKLMVEELKLIRTAREKQELDIPTDGSFKRSARSRASQLVKMAGLDVRNQDHFFLVAAIVFDHLTKNRSAGRRRANSDDEDFDFLEAFASYMNRHTNLKSNVIARVANGLRLFDPRFAAYKDVQGQKRLGKRFERAWRRLREDQMKGLNDARRRRRIALLANLDRRFGKVAQGG